MSGSETKLHLPSSRLDAQLRKACATGNVDHASTLLKRKANVNAVEIGSRNTSLHYAARNNHAPVVKLLIEHRATVNVQNSTGWTPLMAHLLDFEEEEEPQQQQPQQQQPQQQQQQQQEKEGKDDEEEERENNNNDEKKKKNKMEVLHLLFDGGADANQADHNQSTPLMLSAARNRRSALSLLLEKKADVDARHALGHTALIRACYQGNTEIAGALLRWKADVSCRDNRGADCLEYCAQKNHVDCVSLLCDMSDVDVNQRNPIRGVLPVSLAAQNGSFDTVYLLLDRKSENPYSLFLWCLRGSPQDDAMDEASFRVLCRGCPYSLQHDYGDVFLCEQAASRVSYLSNTNAYVQERFALLLDVLTSEAIVDLRIGRRECGIMDEALEVVLCYLGLRLKVKVMNPTIPGAEQTHMWLPEGDLFWFTHMRDVVHTIN